MLWNSQWRSATWSALDQPWDIIVIGGGVTGAGILREAARTGRRVLLVEAHDFASGTSSRSSKLVHGGFRYLRNAQLRITLASIRERERLLREGKGLINRLGFLFVGLPQDPLPLWTIGVGLSIYDLLALRWQHRYYDAATLQDLCPALTTPELRGGYRYFDAVTDDARLVFRLLREAVADGATALNYARVERLLQTRDGQIRGVALQDQTPGNSSRTLELQAPVVINATGAWAETVWAAPARTARLRTVRGSHLVLPHTRLPLTRAISFWHPADGRAVFAVPWEGVTLMGTTDIDHPPPVPIDPVISPAEVAYLMQGLAHVFPALDLSIQDVRAAYAGVRAVINTGRADPSKESREHLLWADPGLLTVSGGKLTTFRLMARDVLRAAAADLSAARTPVLISQILDQPPVNFPPGAGLLEPTAQLRLLGRYGPEFSAFIAASPPADLALLPGTQTRWAELRWAVRAEGIVHLDDLLLRRVRLGLTLPHGGLEFTEQLRVLVQAELGWDARRWAAEVHDYTALLKQSYRLG